MRAVGFYADASGNYHALIETFASGTWNAQEATAPANAGPNEDGDTVAELTSVSCISSACAASGAYTDTTGSSRGLVSTLSGSTWTTTQAPEPANAATDATQVLTNLQSVSWASADDCVAVGYYEDQTHGDVHGLVDTFDGTSWNALESPQPANAASPTDTDPYVSLNAVSCSSACVAVGFYNDHAGNPLPLIVSEGLLGWSAQEAPLPSGAGNGTTGTEDSQLLAVSCSGLTCVAGGTYEDTAGHTGALIESSSLGLWGTVGASPADAATGTASFGQIDAVSCGANACEAVGYYATTVGTDAALTVTINASGSSAAASPAPANASDAFASLDSVSCTSLGACGAAGTYQDTSGNYEGLLSLLPAPS